MLISITVQYERDSCLTYPKIMTEEFTVILTYIINYRIIRKCLKATPVLLHHLRRSVQSGHYRIGVDEPGDRTFYSYRNRYEDHDHFKAYIILYPADLTWCKHCNEVLTTPAEIRHGICIVCYQAETELYIARELVGMHLLPDDEEEYYRGLVE